MNSNSESAAGFRQNSDHVLSLAPEHRFELAQKLWYSLGEELPIVEAPELLAVLRRRAREIEEGTAMTVDEDVVMRELREKLVDSGDY